MGFCDPWIGVKCLVRRPDVWHFGPWWLVHGTMEATTMTPGAAQMSLSSHVLWVHVHFPLTPEPVKAQRSDLGYQQPCGREGLQTWVLCHSLLSCHSTSRCFLVPCGAQRAKQRGSRQVTSVQRLRAYSTRYQAHQLNCNIECLLSAWRLYSLHCHVRSTFPWKLKLWQIEDPASVALT